VGFSQQLSHGFTTVWVFLFLKIASLNVYVFIGSWSYLQELCNKLDIIVRQEHWLSDCQMHYLNCINKDFCVYAKTVMTLSHE